MMRAVTEAPCPNCRQPLEPLAIAGLYRQLTIDLCAACQGFWFDENESLQLSPEGTLMLFRLVHERHDQRRHALADRLQCPRCDLKLSLVVDQQRDTKFQYYRCARGHGRFMTFFHFLRARNFVRNLSPRELADLRARIRQVNCSNCGAPVDLDGHVACDYCRAPVSMLDAAQVQTTLRDLHAAADRRQQPDPAWPLAAMMERLEVERVFSETQASRPGRPGVEGLVEAGLGTIFDWLASRRP
jgi:Zn-finger nucleic acid-binding protein